MDPQSIVMPASRRDHIVNCWHPGGESIGLSERDRVRRSLSSGKMRRMKVGHVNEKGGFDFAAHLDMRGPSGVSTDRLANYRRRTLKDILFDAAMDSVPVSRNIEVPRPADSRGGASHHSPKQTNP